MLQCASALPPVRWNPLWQLREKAPGYTDRFSWVDVGTIQVGSVDLTTPVRRRRQFVRDTEAHLLFNRSSRVFYFASLVLSLNLRQPLETSMRMCSRTKTPRSSASIFATSFEPLAGTASGSGLRRGKNRKVESRHAATNTKDPSIHKARSR